MFLSCRLIMSQDRQQGPAGPGRLGSLTVSDRFSLARIVISPDELVENRRNRCNRNMCAGNPSLLGG